MIHHSPRTVFLIPLIAGLLLPPLMLALTGAGALIVAGVFIGYRPAADLWFGLPLLSLALLGRPLALCMLAKRHAPRRIDNPKSKIQNPKSASGARLHVECTGAPGAPMLLLTPGLAQTTRVWDDVSALAGPECQVVTWDLPGLGRSAPRPDNDYSTTALAHDLRAVLEAQKARLGPAGVVLVGQSLSPMLILEFCRLYPDQLGHPVAGLVLVSGTDSPPLTTMARGAFWSRLRRPLIEPALHLVSALGPLFNLLLRLGYHNGSVIVDTHAVGFSGRETRPELDRLARMISHNDVAVIARLALGCLDFDARLLLPQIPIPVLLLAGAGDFAVLPSTSEGMARRLPQAHLELWRPARHVPCLEYPARFNRLLRDFLTRIEAAPASRSPAITDTVAD